KDHSASLGFSDGYSGIAYAFIIAYRRLKNQKYRIVAERALKNTPIQFIYNDFSINSGISGIGLAYLSAYEFLGDDTWKMRADAVANILINTFCKDSQGGGCWRMEANDNPTASLYT
ncbi:hypothetical protein KK062_30195, partial [Fulvivirgaceae bacterium PWU5]